MATIDDFLQANPALRQDDEKLAHSRKEISLNVGITAVSPTRVEFIYSGQRFTVKRDDVIEISENTGVHSNIGKSAILSIKSDALLTSQNEVPISRLTAPLPFAFRNSARPFPTVRSAADERWRSRVGYPIESTEAAASTSTTITVSGGVTDDSASDTYD